MKHHPTPIFRSYELPWVLYGDQRLVLNLQDRIVTLLGGRGQLDAQPLPEAGGYRLFQLSLP